MRQKGRERRICVPEARLSVSETRLFASETRLFAVARRQAGASEGPTLRQGGGYEPVPGSGRIEGGLSPAPSLPFGLAGTPRFTTVSRACFGSVTG